MLPWKGQGLCTFPIQMEQKQDNSQICQSRCCELLLSFKFRISHTYDLILISLFVHVSKHLSNLRGDPLGALVRQFTMQSDMLWPFANKRRNMRVELECDELQNKVFWYGKLQTSDHLWQLTKNCLHCEKKYMVSGGGIRKKSKQDCQGSDQVRCLNISSYWMNSLSADGVVWEFAK